MRRVTDGVRGQATVVLGRDQYNQWRIGHLQWRPSYPWFSTGNTCSVRRWSRDLVTPWPLFSHQPCPVICHFSVFENLADFYPAFWTLIPKRVRFTFSFWIRFIFSFWISFISRFHSSLCFHFISGPTAYSSLKVKNFITVWSIKIVELFPSTTLHYRLFGKWAIWLICCRLVTIKLIDFAGINQLINVYVGGIIKS